MTKAKFKKYRVIVDFYEAREESARDQIQFYRDEYNEELSEDTADQWAVDDLYDYARNELTDEIDRHAPHGIAVFADLGLWNGRRRGIKIVDSFRDVLALCDDLMYVTIETTPQGLTVYAPHHDGTNVYTLRALTKAGANRWSDYDDELEQSLIHGSPRTLRRYTKNIKNLWED